MSSLSSSTITLCMKYRRVGQWLRCPFGYDFVSINVDDDVDPSPPHLLVPVIPPPQEVGDFTRWCTMGSKIYGVGGYTLMRRPNDKSFADHKASRELIVFDTQCPEKGWEGLHIMNRARKICQVAAVQGKLYVFGSSNPEPPEFEDPFLWGEVYHPEDDVWTPLDMFSPIIDNKCFVAEGFSSVADKKCLIALKVVVVHKLNQILVWFNRGQKQYHCFDLKRQRWESETSKTLLGSCIAVDNMIYTVVNVSGVGLFAYDLAQKEPKYVEIIDGNLDEHHHCPPRHHYLNESRITPDDRRFLIHLGDDKFCMVWSDIHMDDDDIFDNDVAENNPKYNPENSPDFNPTQIIHCLKFSILQSGGEFKACVDKCVTHYARGYHLDACFRICGDKEVEVQYKPQVQVSNPYEALDDQEE